MFSTIVPSLKNLQCLIVPSNGFRRSEVFHALHVCITSLIKKQGTTLKTLNIGNNLFRPSQLLRLVEVALCEESMLKRLVIAFSNLGNEEEDQQQ